MLLITLDIDGTTRRVSNEELSLTYPWFAEVSKAPTFKYATDKLYGGYCEPAIGGFSLAPGVTRERKLGITVQHTETDESDAVDFFNGIAFRNGFDRYGVNYDLKKPDDDVNISGSITGNLQAIFSTYCGASYINKTLDTSATSRDPAVSYTVSSDTPVRDVLSAIAAFFSHGFWEDETTVYLYDCLEDNGTLAVDEFDFTPVSYIDTHPVSVFKVGDYSVSGTYPNGNEFSISPGCHTAQANIEAALADIKTTMELPGAIIKLPMCEKVNGIRPGIRISWTDASQDPPVAMWIRAQSIFYDFAQDTAVIVVEGKGDVEAYYFEDSGTFDDEELWLG